MKLDADAVIIDLEDACPVAEKALARTHVVDALGLGSELPIIVRTNGLDTPFAYGDLNSIVLPGLAAVMLPKAESAQQIAVLDWMLRQLARERGLRADAIAIIPLIESAAGLNGASEIARASSLVRFLAFGAADYTLDIGSTWSADEMELISARQSLVIASRIAGVAAPVDTPWIRIDDDEGFGHSVTKARALGFQGKLCIHPKQLTEVNLAFSPSPEEIAKAFAIVKAFEAAERMGSAALRVDGGFVDYPIYERAQRLLQTVGEG